jgi:glutathione synthase/RimK-type ligase-like ATP-grasp enzyme
MTTAQKNVIIVSPGDDLHALAVRQRLQAIYGDAVAVTIFDSATSPIASTISWSSWSKNDVSEADFEAHIGPPLAENIGPKAGVVLRDQAGKSTPLSSSSVHSVWLRRPRDGIIHPKVEIPEHRDFAADSVKILLRSFLEAAKTYNPYFVEWRANQKPFQLWSANRVGLSVPRTLITSVPEQAKEFYLHLRQGGVECVYKRIGTARGFDFATRLFDEYALERLDSLRFAPIILQERIIGGPNIRVVVAGSNIFSAEWRSENEPGDPVDIRDDECATMWRTELPDPFKALLLRLHQELGLVFGVYDLKYGSSGALYFLEVNPSGQWLDLEYQAELPVSETWARVLVDGRDTALSNELVLLTPESLDHFGAGVEQTQIEWVRFV